MGAERREGKSDGMEREGKGIPRKVKASRIKTDRKFTIPAWLQQQQQQVYQPQCLTRLSAASLSQSVVGWVDMNWVVLVWIESGN